MKLQVSSNQREPLNTANKYLKSILPVESQICVLLESVACRETRERIWDDFRYCNDSC